MNILVNPILAGHGYSNTCNDPLTDLYKTYSHFNVNALFDHTYLAQLTSIVHWFCSIISNHVHPPNLSCVSKTSVANLIFA